jgi:DegV family protein with EDD domain
MQNENFKNKIGIVADEGGDLPEELIKKHKITIVPFKVDFGEMKNLPGNVYQKIREAEKRRIKSFVKTSQPSPGDFLKAFREKLKEFEEIICITITSKHSGTFNSALQAKEFLAEKGKIHIVDSLNGSGGEGLIILKAAELIEKKLKIKEILERLKGAISKTHLIVMLQDPKWLEASGRISHILANVLKGMQKIGIRPLIGIKRGRILPVKIKRKAKDTADSIFKEFESRILKKAGAEKIKIAITHADNLKETLKLKEKIERLKNCEVVFLNLIGNILGGLAGPGAIALAYQYD